MLNNTCAAMDRIEKQLYETNLGKLAYETGFMVREPRKVGPETYVKAFCLNAALNTSKTISQYAAQMSLLTQTVISKQAITEKIKQPFIQLLKKFYTC